MTGTRITVLDRIATAIGRQADRPAGLEELAERTLSGQQNANGQQSASPSTSATPLPDPQGPNLELPNNTSIVRRLRITISYDIPRDVQLKGQYALDSFPEEHHNPFSDHDDFINVNSARTMQRIATCINKGRNCA